MKRGGGGYRYLSLLVGLIAVPAVVVALPFGIIGASVFRGLDRRRLARAARTFKCPGCGTMVGRDGVRLADIACSIFRDEVERANPDVEFTIVRRVDVVCTRCQNRFLFCPMSSTFEKVCAKEPPCRLTV